MNRIARSGRRYGRDNDDESEISGTNLIKLAESTGKVGGKPPTKFNGFVTYHRTKGANNCFVLDYDSMERLGYPKEKVDEAMRIGFNADPSLLPQTMRFVLMHDAVDTGEKDDKGRTIWNYPKTYASIYNAYDKRGRFCRGDGVNAIRRQDDGTEKIIPCNPYGKKGCNAADFCQFSGPDRPCKLKLNFASCLYFWSKTKLDDEGNPLPGARPDFVSRSLGMQAIYVLKTSSEYVDMDLVDALDMLSDRVRGRIGGITGTMTFMKTGRRTGKTGNDEASKAITPFAFIQFDEAAIRAREMQISAEDSQHYNRLIEAGKAGVTLSLPAPITTHDPVIDVSAVGTEPTDPFETPDGLPSDYQPADVTVEPEPSRARLAVAQASDDQLAAALGDYLDRFAGADDQRYRDQLNFLAFGHPDGIQRDGRTIQTADLPDWFLKGEPGPKDARRRAILREVCQKLETAGDTLFFIQAAQAEEAEL